MKDECRVPVDAKLVVSRTRDGGKSFDVLRRGLPQENAYDIVYRHGLAVDESGNRLAFGSVNANRKHYELAADALKWADRSWLARLITRRVPLDRWADAVHRRPGDIKVLIDFAVDQRQ